MSLIRRLRSGAPGAQYVEGGNGRGFVVRLGGVPIDGGGGLGAEVAGFGVKIERADAVFTVRAGEPYAALHALDTVGFHSCIVILGEQDGALDGVAAKVTGGTGPKVTGGTGPRRRGLGGAAALPRALCWTGEGARRPIVAGKNARAT